MGTFDVRIVATIRLDAKDLDEAIAAATRTMYQLELKDADHRSHVVEIETTGAWKL